MTDCLIVGAGIIGMLTARLLRQEGLSVTVVERGESGRESSWAGGGILSPLYPWRYPDAVNDLARWSQSRYPALLEQIHVESDIDPEYRQSGLLILDVDEGPARDWAQRFAADCAWVDQDAEEAIEPRLGLTSEAGCWLPLVGQVRNPRFARALRVSCERLGIRFRENCEVTAIRTEGGSARGVATTTGTLNADRVVVASGAWSGGVLQATGLELAVEPVRGQMILFRGAPDLVRHMVLSEGRYVIPRKDGRILVGSTLERVGFDKATTEEARHDLHASALQLIPALADLPIEHHWSGLRPGSPQGIPAIGPHPAISNLYINAGHYRNGVVIGYASARLLADQLLEREPIFPVETYNPEKIAG